MREFCPPKTINFEATDYTNLIDWKKVTHASDLEKALWDPFYLESNVPAFPCHIQAVERTVQLVSQASKAVTNAEMRDGFIRVTIKSRKSMPKFTTKSQYNCSS